MASSAKPRSQKSAILFQNASHDVTLVDIPTSIAVAQGRFDTLLSRPAVEKPIPLNDEPKTAQQRARTHATRDLAASALQKEYKKTIEAGLAEIRNHVSGAWCVQRQYMSQQPGTGSADMQIDDSEKDLEQRLREWSVLDESKGDDNAFDFQKMMASLGAPAERDAAVTETPSRRWYMSYGLAREIEDREEHPRLHPKKESEVMQVPWTSSFHNPEGHALEVEIFKGVTQPHGPRYRFTVPPRATCFNISTESGIFRTSFRRITDEYTLPRHFDLVLLDPPWPNRSAKRKGAYEQIGGMPYMKKLLLKLDIDTYLEHDSLVGIWITNKEAMRDCVLGAGGLFEKWNVGLLEEWIWVKTTVHGEPMFDIDSFTRKPYETFLLGRTAPNAWTSIPLASSVNVKKRIIAAVPDVHSRKPCLKELLEPYMPDSRDYSTLEVFARHLVSGWTSWGTEALKYNSDQYWASKLPKSSMSLPIYIVSSVGAPRDHHAIFVETQHDGSGHIFQVTGNIQQGMTFEEKPSKRPQDDESFLSMEIVGSIAQSDYDRLQGVFEAVEVPVKQFDGPKRIDPTKPLRRCQEWTREAVRALRDHGILQVSGPV